MKLLIIGGTRFVGKHFVIEALGRGHEVTLFNRGSRPAPEGTSEVILGDRNHDLGLLAGKGWDAVVDTSGYFPRQVRRAAEALKSSVERYLFVSTISVYDDQLIAHQDESAPLAQLTDDGLLELDEQDPQQTSEEMYGPLKALAEEALAQVYSDERRLVVRPGIIVGPDDPTDRFTYWPARVAAGGEVLAPQGPELALQWIDVRDLARWLVTALEAGTSGTYNAVSEPGRFSLGDVLRAAQAASGADATITWVDEEFLLAQGVLPFADLPLWLPGKLGNLWTVDTAKAKAAGLKIRAVEETVAATLEWHGARGAPELDFGMSREREREVLAAWHGRAKGAPT